MAKNIMMIMPMLSMVGQAKSGSVVVTFNRPTDSDYHYEAEVISLNAKGSANPFVRLYRFFDRIRQVRRLKKELGIDWAISFGESGNYINLLSGGKAKTCISVREHKTERFRYDRSLEGKVHRWLMTRLYPRADLVVSQTRSVEHDLIENFGIDPSRSAVIPNPYDLDLLRRLADEALEAPMDTLFSRHKVIVNTGRLSRQKGQWHLIRIFAEVKKRIPEARLVMIGQAEQLDPDGAYLKGYVKTLCHALNLNAFYAWEADELTADYDVYFLGFKKNPFKYVKKASLFAFPSFWEGFPNALAEAMACGVPIVASDCQSGPREILAPDSGLELRAKAMELAPFGIIMPVLSGDYLPADAGLEKEEAIWADTLVKVLEESELSHRYGEAALGRILDFEKGRVAAMWEGMMNEH